MLIAVALVALLLPTTNVLSRGARLVWLTESVEVGSPTGLFTSLALDGNGTPHITYLDRGSDSIKYATRTGDAWAIQVVDSRGGFGGSTDLSIDDTGRPHITFFSAVDGFVNYATWDGASWQRQRVASGFFEGFTSIALDSAGGIHLAYADFNGKLRHGFWNGTQWSLQRVDLEVVTARYMTISVDSRDVPHIAYYGLGNLRYASWNGTAWAVEVIDPVEGAGLYAKLALDSQDRPHVAYRDAMTKKLKYAHRGASSWALEILDLSGDTGWDVDLAVDGRDGVHVSYYERLGAELRYASPVLGSWRIDRVDSEGVVGWFTSLAVGDDGVPHISYHDWSRGSLKYATGVVRLAVRTLEPRDVTSTGALLRGELLSLGNFLQTGVSFEWRVKGAEDWESSPRQLRLSEGIFEAPILNLMPETEYEFRAMVEVAERTLRGEAVNFRTPLPEEGVAPQSDVVPVLVAVAFVGFLFGGLLFALLQSSRKGRIRP